MGRDPAVVSQLLESFARADQMIHDESLRLLRQAGSDLRSLVASDRLQLGVDRPRARQMLDKVDIAKVMAATGVEIRSEARVGTLLYLLSAWAVIVWIGLSFWAFGWWGIAAIPAAAILLFFCEKSNRTGGAFSILLAIAFGIIALLTGTDPLFYWALMGALFTAGMRYSYVVATRVVRRAALESPEFAVLAIEWGAVVIRDPHALGD